MIRATASAQRSTARGPATLAVLSVAQFLIALDYSIIYIALPSIGADLHVDAAVAQWVVSAYAVLFAGFLVVGGRLADLVGHRRLFVVAIVTFGIASAIGSVAIDATMLLIARGAQGIGAALLQPAVLGLIGTTFPAGPARSKALAVWGSVGASGLAVGAILGGVLTTASWRLTFVINVPLTLRARRGRSPGSVRTARPVTPTRPAVPRFSPRCSVPGRCSRWSSGSRSPPPRAGRPGSPSAASPPRWCCSSRSSATRRHPPTC